ncbi:MAG: 2-oxoglutarate dehydrogenase E1 subunit family protein, partial [Acidimicrobiales bacterium]
MTDGRDPRVGDHQLGDFGPNDWLLEDTYERFLEDPESVGESWREFFAGYRPTPVRAPHP